MKREGGGYFYFLFVIYLIGKYQIKNGYEDMYIYLDYFSKINKSLKNMFFLFMRLFYSESCSFFVFFELDC